MSEALARKTDPETSHAAAAVVDVNAMERVVLTQLWNAHPGGMTCSEIAYHSRNPRDSISPRMKQMMEKGLVETLGQKRVPILVDDGRRKPKQLVWLLTPSGKDAAMKITRVQLSEPT